MLSIDSLRVFGANTDEGLSRCMGNEGFYLRMVKLACGDANFEALAEAVERNDLNAAFEAAHALKGVLANLALTPISEPVGVLTEQLRSRTPGDYRGQVEEILALRGDLRAMDG